MRPRWTDGSADGNFFTRRMFWRQYIPALVSAMTLAVGDIADAVVVGNRMGAVGLAAIAFALPVFMVYNVVMHSFGLGGSIRYAGKMSRGEEEAAVRGFRGVLYCLVLIGAAIAVAGNLLLRPLLRVLGADPAKTLLFATTATYVRLVLWAAPLFFTAYSLGYYMRNADLEREASLSASVGNICDIALNVILVLFCHMGAAGAGIATLSGVLITTVMDLIFLRVRESPLRLLPLKADFTGVWSAFRTGFSSSASYVYSLVYILLCNNLLMRMAGETGLAVFDVIQNMSYLFGYLYGAGSQAAQPIMSTYHGEHNREGCRTLERLCSRVTMAVGLVAAGVVLALAPGICRFFGLTGPEAISIGAEAVRIHCVSTCFAGLNMLIGGYFLARDEVIPAFISATLRGAAILLPMTILFSFLGIRRFWLLYPVTELLALVILLLYLKYRYQNRGDIAPERIYRAMLHDRAEEVGTVTGQIEAFCGRWDANPKQHYFVQMTVEEVCTAIIVNGFGQGGDRHGMIQITLVAGEDGIFTLHVRDSAVAFNPFGMDSADLKGDGEDLDFNAVGMDVIKQKAREFYYRRYQGFNTMVVKI